LVDDKNAKKYSEDYIRISDSLQVAERNSKDRFDRLQLETDEIKKRITISKKKQKHPQLLHGYHGYWWVLVFYEGTTSTQ